MNILGLIFSLLLILSYGFFSCWDRQVGSNRLCKSYVGHEKANRKLINSYQSTVYKSLRSKSNPTKAKAETQSQNAPKKTKELPLNRVCSKMNLWPLIQEGKEAQPLLYELTAKMIRTFYEPVFNGRKRFEYHFLDAFLSAAKMAAQEDPLFALEKIDLKEDLLQRCYYKMLKGTKQWNLVQHVGYPSLLEYVKTEPTKDKICIFHAHPDLITVLFNQKIATLLYEEIHKEDAPLLTQELVERICSEQHLVGIDQELFDLLELGRPHHEENKKTFIAEDKDTHVTLKKSFYLKG
ncbi:MAG: hypothetical protein COT85_06025 [Chlamydiae bacterium CG10_big_fil_rev_8_21_14_0_10_42_34]|nr:MAG: hypothetical protein COT85_06025 [Chlamydiae bacterium CG10_big_fil_rev_8_21_14_0_10_42_34]